MHRKDELSMAKTYSQILEEGLLGRTAARYNSAKATLGGLKDRVSGYGQGLKAIGQGLTGNITGAKQTLVSAADRIEGAKNAGLISKINTVVQRGASDMVNDLDKLGINNKSNPLKTNELISKINQILVNRGISPKALTAAPEEPAPSIRDAKPEAELIETPAVGEPAVETPAVEEPAVEEPAVEEPAVEEPAVEEPAVEEPAVGEPAVETPAVEEPAVETPAVEEPAVEEPVSVTPAPEDKNIKFLADTEAELEKLNKVKEKNRDIKWTQETNRLKKIIADTKKQLENPTESFRAYFKSKFII
jgi:hypothetical protein